MNYLEEMKFRKEILLKVCNGEKVKKEEREWLKSHITYNEKYGYPYLCEDVIQLKKNTQYILTIKFIKKNNNNLIEPVLSVPLRKGSFYIDYELQDYKGNKKEKSTPVKSIRVPVDFDTSEVKVYFQSKDGLLSICYYGQYFDENQKALIGSYSSSDDTRLVMRKEIISKDEIIYFCKEPGYNDNLNSFVFSLSIGNNVG